MPIQVATIDRDTKHFSIQEFAKADDIPWGTIAAIIDVNDYSNWTANGPAQIDLMDVKVQTAIKRKLINLNLRPVPYRFTISRTTGKWEHRGGQ